MRAFYKRHHSLNSKLCMTKDVPLSIDGIDAIIEFSHHSVGRGKERSVFDHAVIYMIQRAFNDILDLKSGERFIIIDEELCISMVGGIEALGKELIISVISAIDSDEPHNPHNTIQFVV